jgi:hypothetical protein
MTLLFISRFHRVIQIKLPNKNYIYVSAFKVGSEIRLLRSKCIDGHFWWFDALINSTMPAANTLVRKDLERIGDPAAYLLLLTYTFSNDLRPTPPSKPSGTAAEPPNMLGVRVLYLTHSSRPCVGISDHSFILAGTTPTDQQQTNLLLTLSVLFAC